MAEKRLLIQLRVIKSKENFINNLILFFSIFAKFYTKHETNLLPIFFAFCR